MFCDSSIVDFEVLLDVYYVVLVSDLLAFVLGPGFGTEHWCCYMWNWS